MDHSSFLRSSLSLGSAVPSGGICDLRLQECKGCRVAVPPALCFQADSSMGKPAQRFKEYSGAWDYLSGIALPLLARQRPLRPFHPCRCAKVAVALKERMKRKLEMEENDARFPGMVATLDAEPGYKEPAQDDGESHQPQSGEIETQHAIANS